MAYLSLWESLASDPRGVKGTIIAINQALYDLWEAIGAIGVSWGDSTYQRISSGTATFESGYYNYVLDTEHLIFADDLDKFSGVPENRKIIVRARSADRVITLKSGDFLKLRGDFILNGIYDNIVLVSAGSDVCYEESRSSPNLGESLLYDEDEDMRFGTAYDLSIVSGVITGDSTHRNLRVDTEAGVASDDLTGILGYTEGDVVVISPAHASRTVVVKNGGSLYLTGLDFSLDDIYDSITLMCLGGNVWKELARSAN